MKKVKKGPEPNSLAGYRQAKPNSTWEEMVEDPYYGGKRAHKDIKARTSRDQGGICAYCEFSITSGNPLVQRIEHFHPKSDKNAAHNWALDWNNLLMVCSGGENPHVKQLGYHLEPNEKNRSCDSFKNTMIEKSQLPESCEGWILNPLIMPSFPNLFKLDRGTGKLEPDFTACQSRPDIAPNNLGSTEALVRNTIDMLNLNCDRLNQNRLRVQWNIEREKKKKRKNGMNPANALSMLAARYLSKPWPQYFTTIRCCLGPEAEKYLSSINYQG